MLGEILNAVRRESPLVHCINNYVTANDCANLLLAAGASPIMADDPAESAEITARCRGLVLNLGTPDSRRLEAMVLSGQEAARRHIPVLLDPVGVGASAFRQEAAVQMLTSFPLTAVRGNMSELRTLMGLQSHGSGVDAGQPDNVTEQTLPDVLPFLQAFSRKTGAVAMVTGEMDLVCGGERVFVLRGGHPILSRITGSGCMLSALTGAFLAARPDHPLEAAAAAAASMKLCGERAAAALLPGEGSGFFRVRLMDALYNLTGEDLERGARYEMR